MANNLAVGGPTIILNSTSTGPGSWFRSQPYIGPMSVQATWSTTAASTTFTGTVNIEVSNDGVTPLNTIAGSISPPANAAPAADGFAINAHWEWIRANTQSISTGSIKVTVTDTNVGA